LGDDVRYIEAVQHGAGKRDNALEIVKQLQTTKEYVSPGELAALYAALGEGSGFCFTQQGLCRT
jgi:hypothetical protein